MNLQHKIISTDTDSIFLKDYEGEIQESNELGAMKLESGYPVNKAYFVRPKMYMTTKPKCKGVRFVKGKEIETFHNLLNKETISQIRKFKQVIIVSDSDEVGIKGADALHHKISINSIVIFPNSTHKDIREMYLVEGKEATKRWIEGQI